MKKLANTFLLAMGFSVFHPDYSRAEPDKIFGKYNTAALTTKTSKKRSFGANTVNPESVAVVHVIRQELPELIRQIAERNGLRATVSAQVAGLVEDLRLPVDIELTIPQLADRFELLWHLDQKRLFVSTRAEQLQRRFRMAEMDRERFLDEIRASGLRAGNNDLAFLPDGETVIISGEKLFIHKIEQIFGKFDGMRIEQLGEIKAGGVKDDRN